jgi:hypothetical protein
LPIDSTVQDALRVAQRYRHTRFPVYENTIDNIVGVLSTKDLLGIAARPGTRAPLTDISLRRLVRPPLVVPQGASVTEVLARMKAEAMRPFDLLEGPLVRGTLYRLEPDHHVFFWMPHHAVWDGWSFDIFIGEVCEFYRALATNTAPVLPALPITYADFAEWQRGWLAGPELEKQVAWWRERLGGELLEIHAAGVLDLHTHPPAPAAVPGSHPRASPLALRTTPGRRRSRSSGSSLRERASPSSRPPPRRASSGPRRASNTGRRSPSAGAAAILPARGAGSCARCRPRWDRPGSR